MAGSKKSSATNSKSPALQTFDAPYELPSEWKWTTLESLGAKEKNAIVDGPFGSNLKLTDYIEDKNGVPVLTTKNLNGDYSANSVRFISYQKFEELKRSEVKSGDILVAKIGSCGKTGIYPENMPSAIIPANLLKMTVDLATSRDYVFHYLNSPVFQDLLKEIISATAQPAFGVSDFRKLPIPLPFQPEQQRIVAKIEQLFAESRTAREALDGVPALIKRFRQAVLAKAFRGELTERDPSDESAEKLLETAHKIKQTHGKRAGRLWGSGAVPQLTEEERDSLPEQWAWAKVKDLGSDPEDTVQVGPMSMRSQDFQESGIPVLNVGCVQWGRFDESKLNFLPENLAIKFERYRIEPSDILFTRSGTVGRSAVTQSHQRGWLMTFHLLRVRVNKHICLPEYLQLVFQGAQHIQRQTRDASIGTTRAGFNTNLLAMLDIPLAPFAEQRRIVAKIEALFAQADAIEAAVNIARRRAEKVDQAILARAFRGEL